MQYIKSQSEINNNCSFHIENQILKNMRRGLIRSSYARIEDAAANFTLVNQAGEFITLHDSLDKGPVAMNFHSSPRDYTARMNELVQFNKELSARGVQHYVITPTLYKPGKHDALDTDGSVELLHDLHHNVFHQYGLANNEYDSGHEMHDQRSSFNIANDHVNAIYLVQPNHKIAFSQVNFNGEPFQYDALIETLLQIN